VGDRDVISQWLCACLALLSAHPSNRPEPDTRAAFLVIRMNLSGSA
jgi:hypothetical protein